MPTLAPGHARSATADDVRSARIDWVDTAKALAIVLVVAYHCSGWLYGWVFGSSTSAVAHVWRAASDLFVPVRMPLFFAVSGLLAVEAVRRSWSGLWRTRLVDLVWPFLVWTALIAPLWFARLAETSGGGGLASKAGFVAGSLVLGGAHYWYLPALVLFLVVGKLVARAPVPALAGAGVLAFVVGPLALPWLTANAPALLAANLGRWMELLFWFLLGCFGRPLLEWIAGHAAWAAVAGAAAFAVVQASGLSAAVPLLAPLLGVSGVVALIGVCALAARGRPIRRLSHYLAVRTLAIYLGHQLLLEVIAVGIRLLRRAVPGLELSVAPAMALWTPVLTVALVWAGVALYDLAMRRGGAWLYRPPARFRLPVVAVPL